MPLSYHYGKEFTCQSLKVQDHTVPAELHFLLSLKKELTSLVVTYYPYGIQSSLINKFHIFTSGLTHLNFSNVLLIA